MTTKQDYGTTKVSLAGIAEAHLKQRSDLGCSDSHLNAIRNTIRLLEDANLTELTDEDLARKVQGLLGTLTAARHGQKNRKPVSARTKNHHINLLRTLGEFAVRHRMLLWNPFDRLERYREERNHRKVYTISELRRLVSDEARWPALAKAKTKELLDRHHGDVELAAEAARLTPQCLKHRLEATDGEEDGWWLFVVIAAYTGQRSETVRGITWEMVDWEANRLRLPAWLLKAKQGVREHIQPELAEILRQREAVLIRDLRGRGRPLSELKRMKLVPPHIAKVDSGRANILTQRYHLNNGVIPNGRSVHCFRHTVASLLTATGLSPFLVMDNVGHASAATSKHYSRGADEFVDQVRREGWREGIFRLRAVAAESTSFQRAESQALAAASVPASPIEGRLDAPVWEG